MTSYMLSSQTVFDMSQAAQESTQNQYCTEMVSACGGGRDVSMLYDGYEHLLANNIIYDFCPTPPYALAHRAFTVDSQGANMR